MYQRTYHSKVLAQKAPPEKKHRKKIPWKRVLWISSGVVAATVIVLLIRSPRLQVKDIEVTGTNVADPEEIALFIRSQIEGNFLYIFPKSSMLLVPTTTLTKRVAHAFPRFARVDVRRKGIRDLAVTVTEYEGKYLWCESETSCFFMTQEGLVFAEAPFFSGDAYQKIFIGERGVLPFSPLSPKERALIELLLLRLPSVGITPTEFHWVSAHEIDVRFSHNRQTATLMIDPEEDAEKMLEALATALSTDPLKTQFHKTGSVLEYLDARFANKVIYRFK